MPFQNIFYLLRIPEIPQISLQGYLVTDKTIERMLRVALLLFILFPGLRIDGNAEFSRLIRITMRSLVVVGVYIVSCIAGVFCKPAFIS
jgi:hypothetical protein